MLNSRGTPIFTSISCLPLSPLANQPRRKVTTTGLIKYVGYYRVSTKAQSDSGLGLQAQRVAVAGYVKGVIVSEYTEVESGKNNQRLQLAAAIDQAKKEGAVLVIAKLDRLSRNAYFIFTLRDSGVTFQCVDMPDANTLTIGIFATMAQHDRTGEPAGIDQLTNPSGLTS